MDTANVDRADIRLRRLFEDGDGSHHDPVSDQLGMWEAGMGKALRSIAVISAVLLLGGCWWAQPRYSATRTSYNPYETNVTAANVDQLAPVWHSAAPAEGFPVVRWENRLLAGYGSATHGLETETGAEVWQTGVTVRPAGTATVLWGM
jgi:hypothetical protein